MDNAREGVKKLFQAQVIELIVAAIAFILLIIVKIPGIPEAVVAAAGVISLVTIVASLIAFVLQLLGLRIGGEESKLLNLGFWVVVISLVITLADAIMQLARAPKLATDICEIAVGLCQVLVSYFILAGVAEICLKFGEEKLAKKGKLLAYIGLALYALGVILSAVSYFVSTADEVGLAIIAILAIVGSLVELICYVLGFIFLGVANSTNA